MRGQVNNDSGPFVFDNLASVLFISFKVVKICQSLEQSAGHMLTTAWSLGLVTLLSWGQGVEGAMCRQSRIGFWR